MDGRRAVEVVRSQAFRGVTAGAVLSMVMVGCGAPVTVGDAAILSRQLQAEFHRPAAVTLDGRRHLIVTVQASSADTDSTGASADSTDPAAQAYQVARFVGAHYQHARSLKDLTVIVEPPPADSAGQPSSSTFTASEIDPIAPRVVPPGTKSD